MSYRSLEDQGGAPDERDAVQIFYDRSPYAIRFGHALETTRFVPNDQANQRFVDVAGRKCDNCIGQAAVVSDRSGARSFSFNELGLARREVRSIVAPVSKVAPSAGGSETFLPEIAFYEVENGYTAFGDSVQEKFTESAPMNPATACISAGVNTCLARFTIGRKYAPDGAVAQLLFNGKAVVNAAQDALGRPAVRWTSNGIATGYRYDPRDLRLNQMSTLTAAQPGGNGSFMPVQINGYQYDGGGNIVAYSNNADPIQKYTSAFVFGYDAVNRLTGFDARVSNDKDNHDNKFAGSLTSSGTYKYDTGHRFKSRSLKIIGEPGRLLERQWTYHYRSDPTTGPLHAPRKIDFNLDDFTRVTSFDYDDVGRMTRICTRPNTDDNDSRICSVGDAGGDQRAGLLSNRAMTWDAEGRLIRVRGVKDPALPSNAELMREDYVYDAGGNRTLAIHPDPQTENAPPGNREAVTIYMTPYYARPYDGRGMVQLSLGTLPAVSLAAPADPSEYPRATFLYSDLPVGSMTAAVTTYGEATDANATLIARREYSPYGLELTVDGLAQTGREDAPPVSVFHGKELDRHTKFSSFGARYYSRDLGIWLKPDPAMPTYLNGVPNGGVFSPAHLSGYAFVHQNPIAIQDPNGEFGVAGALVGAGVDLAVQGLLVYTGHQQSISWTSVVVSAAAGATGVGLSSVITKSAARYGASKLMAFGATFIGETAIGVGEQALKGEEISVTSAALNVAGGHLIGAAAGKVTDLAGKAIKRFHGTCSFDANTLVATEQGPQPISALVSGQKVLARSEDTGEVGWKRVLDHYRNTYDERVTIRIRDAETGLEQSIVSNRIHPFFVQVPPLHDSNQAADGKWVEAQHLEPGNQLLAAGGKRVEVTSVAIEQVPLVAYNLSVEEFSTYFVAGSASSPLIWVHNDCFNLRKLLDALGIEEKAFHGTKKEILTDFGPELRKTGVTNPDIGVNEAGNIIFRDPRTKKVILSTEVPLSSFGEK
ncbi:polymorphic toxin-type HINT domain-containing protein [Bradyrhizobium japonicum]|uniref:polymorphic toxin-type HINT domain-containing protein n=1 Tax=Bradyrhizobium japonicum TaxID=375 RepID=UPI001BA7972C|nr:polymorphic toxin-type HINT domain-containing protein [Bradyrhizobium japonicum]MBR0959531.1 hypothetical protein [Bradyrhizobium japonicum]